MKKIFAVFFFLLSTFTTASSMPLDAAAIEKEREPVVILGGGIGSLTSALYMARAGLSPLVIEGQVPGGLLTQSHTVQNWPGEMEIDGPSLMQKVRSQAEANGARFSTEEVIAVDFSKEPFVLTLRSLEIPYATRTLIADSCIIGMGTTPNFLNVPGEKDYWGRGVTNCAICDGSLYRGKQVGVVGGGDAAILEALYLSNIANEVHVFVRKDSFRAFEAFRVETLKERANVKVHYNTEVIEIKGDGKELKSVLLKNSEGEVIDFSIDGLFLAIGSKPNTKLFEKALKLDKHGYIALKKDQETFVPGVFAVGDIVDPVYKQAISAAGDGAKAALQSQEFLLRKSTHLTKKSKLKKIDLSISGNPKKGKKKKSVTLPRGEVMEISSAKQFKEELKNANSPVIVDFYATWCGPCKRLSPIFESSAEKLAGKVKFLKVDVNKVSELSDSFNIKAMPTALLFDTSGKELERKVGSEDISDLLEDLGSRLGTDKFDNSSEASRH